MIAMLLLACSPGSTVTIDNPADGSEMEHTAADTDTAPEPDYEPTALELALAGPIGGYFKPGTGEDSAAWWPTRWHFADLEEGMGNSGQVVVYVWDRDPRSTNALCLAQYDGDYMVDQDVLAITIDGETYAVLPVISDYGEITWPWEEQGAPGLVYLNPAAPW